MSIQLFVEGGGDSKEIKTRCREGFHRLIAKCGFAGNPRLVACGGRDEAFDRFRTAYDQASAEDFVGLLVDSEDPLRDLAFCWDHLRQRDGWQRPAGAEEGQVMLMVTCMESWIAADRNGLRKHFGACFKESKLPAPRNLEQTDRQVVQDALAEATASCKGSYRKGKRSFILLGQLDPDTLSRHLAGFRDFRAKLAAVVG